MAERTGRTLHELYHGGNGREPISTAEFVQWVALLTVIEPAEQEEANKQ